MMIFMLKDELDQMADRIVRKVGTIMAVCSIVVVVMVVAIVRTTNG